jgi:hypothetical protein
MQMVSLNEGACIAYSATFNGEEDVYFVRAELPIVASVQRLTGAVQISWNGVLGVNYCVQSVTNLTASWSGAATVACLTATNSTPFVIDPSAGNTTRFYRVMR